MLRIKRIRESTNKTNRLASKLSVYFELNIQGYRPDKIRGS